MLNTSQSLAFICGGNVPPAEPVPPERQARRRVFQNKEITMAENDKGVRIKNEGKTPNTKGNAPQHQGGDAARKAQEWGGGNKAAKGPATKADTE
jgi:hypothetical protein